MPTRWRRACAPTATLAALAAFAGLAAEAAPAEANPPDLRLRLPPPRDLTMRPRRIAAAQPAGANAVPSTGPARAAAPKATPSSASPLARTVEDAAAAQTLAALPQRNTLRTGQEELAFRFDLGFALDGAALSGEPTAAGHTIDGQLAQIRSYGFGEIFVGSRGLVLPNLSAYLSANYRFGNALALTAPIAEPDRKANELQVRSGWAEIKNPTGRPWLASLRVRAGRFYVYGPWVTHVDAITGAWDGKILSAALTLGGRVTSLIAGERGGLPSPMSQLTVRADFTAHKSKVPLVASAEVLRMDDHSHVHTQLAWQPRATLAIGAAARTLDGKLVNERVSVRGRFREINAIFAEVVHRHRDDWRWDPAVVLREDLGTTGEAKPYLELGPVLPRVTAQVRAGTVLFDNVDLLARAAAASDLRDETTSPSSFSAAYVELGGAFEVRLRRTLVVGGSVVTRTTRREEVPPISLAPPMDGAPAAGNLPLPADGSYGDKSFVEGGGTVRLHLGARTLTFAGEAYARQTSYAELYTAEGQPEPIDYQTTHLGGRASVDAWVNRRLRVLARYEVVTQVKRAPEITGFKSLRVIVEATF